VTLADFVLLLNAASGTNKSKTFKTIGIYCRSASHVGRNRSRFNGSLCYSSDNIGSNPDDIINTRMERKKLQESLKFFNLAKREFVQ
jgi:hypothetical protein